MGQLQSNEFAIYPSSYQFVKEIYQHPYGQGKLLKNIYNNEKIFQITIESFNVREIKQQINDIETKYKNLKNPFILQLLNWNEEDSCFTIGNYSRYSLYYEYCQYTLADEIQFKKQSSERFSEQEILYLLNAIVNVCHYLQINSTAHKDLRPCNILINQNKQIKFAPVGCFPYDFDAAKKQRNFSQYSYLSPEFQKNLSESNFNWNHCDMYAAGLTLLDAASLNFSYDIIEIRSDQRKQDIIKGRVLSCKQFYSPGLLMIINKMLETNPTKRLKFQELFNFLLPFQSEIMNLQKVNLPIHINLPQRISAPSFKFYQQKNSNQLSILSPQIRRNVFNYNQINYQLVTQKLLNPSPFKKSASHNNSFIIYSHSNQSPMRTPCQLSRSNSHYQQLNGKSAFIQGSPISTQLSFFQTKIQNDTNSLMFRQTSPQISSRQYQENFSNNQMPNHVHNKSIKEQLQQLYSSKQPQQIQQINFEDKKQENIQVIKDQSTKQQQTLKLIQDLNEKLKAVEIKENSLNNTEQQNLKQIQSPSFSTANQFSNDQTNKNAEPLAFSELSQVDKLIDETILKAQEILKQFGEGE